MDTNTGTPIGTPRRPDPAEMSMGELVSSLSEQTSRLVREEVALASTELKEKGRHAGIGAGMFGAAGVVALFGGGALVTTFIALLALAMDVWAAALIVTVVLFALAAVLALTGKKQVAQATPAKPEHATDSVRTDVETVKESARR